MFNTVSKTIGVAVLLSGLAQAAIAAEDTERAVLVLDASGSMWGQVDNTSKIAVARSVIGKLMSDWNPQVQLGLTAYGHREKGNCADIETLVPVGKVNADTIMAAVKDLKPKGKTPLSDAVKQAAMDLKYTEERATVILVSDGKETCNADPCAVASELEKNGIDFTVHVVGFDLTEEEKAQLRCVADNTGGKFLNAKDPSELHKAMTTTVQMVAEAKPAKKRVVKLKAGLTGSLLVKGLSRRTYVAAYAPGKTYKDGIVSFSSGSKHPEQLAAGTYVLATSKQELTQVEIPAGKDVVVNMKEVTGSLLVKGLGRRTYVSAYTPGKTYKDGIASFTSGSKHPEQLVPGTYVVATGKQEIARVDIAAGKDVVVEMAEVTGSLVLKGLTRNTYVSVYKPGKTYKDDIDSFTSGRKHPAQLVPGTYVIGTSKQELGTIELKAGEELVVDLGQ